MSKNVIPDIKKKQQFQKCQIYLKIWSM